MSPQILFVDTVRCTGCGALSKTSRLFSVDPLAAGPEGRHMKPASTYYGSRHLEKIATEIKLTPICIACVDEATVPTISDRESHDRWLLTVKRKREQDQAEKRSEKARVKREISLEDLV